MSSLRLPVFTRSGGDDLELRVECVGSEAIISPVLGTPGLCVPCWLGRRAATHDPRELVAHDSHDIVRAFTLWIRMQDRAKTAAQRQAIARILRCRVQEHRGAEGRSIPPVLTRVAADGVVKHESVVPMLGCTRCTRLRPSSVPEGLGALLGLRAGVVTALDLLPHLPGEPEYPWVVISTLANPRLRMDWPYGSGASGKGASLQDATASAIGEAIERYAGIVFNPELTVGCPSEMHGAVTPLELTGRTQPNHEVAWLRAQPLEARHTPRWVPASAVLLRAPCDAYPPATSPNSNGLAFAPTVEEATNSGLAEVLERHLFLLTWFGGRQVDEPDARHWLDPNVAAAFEAADIELRTGVCGILHGTAVAWASCWPRSQTRRRPAFTLALGTGSSGAEAVKAAVLELAQVYRGLTHAVRSRGLSRRAEDLARDGRKVVTPYDHALFYAIRGPQAAPEPFGLGSPREVARIDGRDLGEPLYVDVTPADVASVTSWRVCRVIVPGAIPMHFGMAELPARMFDFAYFDGDPTQWLHPLA